jgi:ATP-binding cassette, subfamily B (MDR/TAP), member 1
MCASLGLALYTSPKLTLVILAGVPFFIGIIALLTTRVQPVIKQQKKEITKASKIVHDSILGIDTVKCFNAQEFEYCQYSSSIRVSAYWYMKQARLSALRISSNDLLMFSMFSQGFWYGSILVKSDQISAGDLVRTFWACMTAVQSFAQIVNNFATLERGRVAGSTLKEI